MPYDIDGRLGEWFYSIHLPSQKLHSMIHVARSMAKRVASLNQLARRELVEVIIEYKVIGW